MLSEIRNVIEEELRVAERRIMTHLEPLFVEKRVDEFGGTFENTANLFIPDLGQSISIGLKKIHNL